MSILPGSTIGMLGGGQLGRMFTIAARNMGYEVIVLDPDVNSPAGMLATRHICADYSDPAALTTLSQDCDVVTTEFCIRNDDGFVIALAAGTGHAARDFASGKS